jgi:hypothetical protein
MPDAVYHLESGPELAGRGVGCLQLRHHLSSLYLFQKLLQRTSEGYIAVIQFNLSN